MPQRVFNFWLALAGAAALAAVLLIGLDARRLARTGPAWRRRLLSAGLALMTALGLTDCDVQAGRAVAPTAEVLPWAESDDLSTHPRWRSLMAAWREAGESARGRGLLYPIDEAGKGRLLRRLGPVAGDIDYLEQKGLLTNPEAGLLRADLADLTAAVKLLPTTDGPKWEISYGDPKGSLARAEKTVARLAEAKALHAPALPLLRMSIEEAGLTSMGIDDPTGVRERSLARLDELTHPAQAGTPLEESPAWREFEKAWTFAHRVRRSTPGGSVLPEVGDGGTRLPYDDADLVAAVDSLKSAAGKLDGLVRSGALGKVEADALKTQAEELIRAVWWDPYWREFDNGYDARLAKRVPLIRALAESPIVHPEALELILVSVQGDLAKYDEDKDKQATTRPAPTAEEVKREPRSYELTMDDAEAIAKERKTDWESARERTRLRDIIRKLTERLPAPTSDLSRDHRWRFVERAWCEGMLTGRWWYGIYPFTRYGERRTRGELSVAIGYVFDLHAAGALTEAEAGLLAMDLTDLRELLEYFYPSIPLYPSCYNNGTEAYPQGDRATYFRPRLELLRKIAVQDKLNPEVFGKLLTTMEINWSSQWQWSAGTFPEKELTKLKEDSRKVRQQVLDRLKAADAELTRSPHWRTIEQAWRQAVPLVISGRATTARRNAAEEALMQAWIAAEQLAARGLLSPAEAVLVQDEAASLRKNLLRHAPTDTQGRNYRGPGDSREDPFWDTPSVAFRVTEESRFQSVDAFRPLVLELVRQSLHADLAVMKDAWDAKFDQWKRDGGRLSLEERRTILNERLFGKSPALDGDARPKSDTRPSTERESQQQQKEESP